MPRTRFCIKEPLQPASLPPSEPALHPPQASQTHGPLLLLPQDPETPLRPIRSKPLCTRAAAQPDPVRPGGRSVRSVALDVAARAAAENTHVCVICPVAVTPPCDIHPLRQSTHRENKNLGISAIFLRLRTLFCPRKAKMGLHTANYLRFCASTRNWEARNNCQSQKSCNLSRFFVSGLLE